MADTPVEDATLPRFVFFRREFTSRDFHEILLCILRRLVKDAGLLCLAGSGSGSRAGELCGDSSSFGETCLVD